VQHLTSWWGPVWR